MLDAEPPTIADCPDSLWLSPSAGGAYTVNDLTGMINASDNVTATSDLLITQNPVAGSMLQSGDVDTLTITVTDEAMNSTDCDILLGYGNDSSPPVFLSCFSDTSVSANGNCYSDVWDFTSLVEVYDDVTSSDNITLTQSPVAGTVLGQASWPNTGQEICVYATDQSGNTSSCCFNLSVFDNTAPTITCPNDVTVQGNAQGEYDTPNYISASVYSDNCSATGDCVVTQTPLPNEIIGLGINTCEITVVDEAGNISSCEFLITVE